MAEVKERLEELKANLLLMTQGPQSLNAGQYESFVTHVVFPQIDRAIRDLAAVASHAPAAEGSERFNATDQCRCICHDKHFGYTHPKHCRDCADSPAPSAQSGASATQGTQGEEIVSGGATGAIGAESAGASSVQTEDISTGPSLRNEPMTIDRLEEANKFLENWDKFDWQDGYTLERCLESYASSLRSEVERLKAERDRALDKLIEIADIMKAQPGPIPPQVKKLVERAESAERTVSELRAREGKQ